MTIPTLMSILSAPGTGTPSAVAGAELPGAGDTGFACLVQMLLGEQQGAGASAAGARGAQAPADDADTSAQTEAAAAEEAAPVVRPGVGPGAGPGLAGVPVRPGLAPQQAPSESEAVTGAKDEPEADDTSASQSLEGSGQVQTAVIAASAVPVPDQRAAGTAGAVASPTTVTSATSATGTPAALSATPATPATPAMPTTPPADPATPSTPAAPATPSTPASPNAAPAATDSAPPRSHRDANGGRPGDDRPTGANPAGMPVVGSPATDAPSAKAHQAHQAHPALSAAHTEANPAGGSQPTANTTVAGVSTATAPHGADPTPTAGPVGAQVFPEIARLVTRGDGTQRLTLRLSPENLGEVRIVVTVRHGAVDVSLAAGHDAQEALRHGSPELRRLLESVGAASTQIVVRDLPSGSPTTQTTGTQPFGGGATTYAETAGSPGRDHPRGGHHAGQHAGAHGRGDTGAQAHPNPTAPAAAAGVDLKL